MPLEAYPAGLLMSDRQRTESGQVTWAEHYRRLIGDVRLQAPGRLPDCSGLHVPELLKKASVNHKRSI